MFSIFLLQHSKYSEEKSYYSQFLQDQICVLMKMQTKNQLEGKGKDFGILTASFFLQYAELYVSFKLQFKTAKIDLTYYVFWYVITSLLGSKTLKFLRCGNLNENTEGGRKIFSG